MEYLFVKWLHVLSSTLLFGTGLGSAFYMFFTNRTRNVQAIASVSRRVVIADWLFTTPTAIIQPATGFYLVYLAGFPFDGWVLWSTALYVFAGACWLPVVWIQIKMARIAGEAAQRKSEELPLSYWRWHRIWTGLGIPAFLAFIGIFYLMVFKPS
ncbi:MAG TPA: DUF2269 domain-containing protein [Burkholderiales bacterium]|nr:DUF2269 domain-containing protein [Burkholderiales bacterium]